MIAVSITNVAVLDNPAPFSSPLMFQIQYESVASLNEDLEWKLIYVGSADDESYDQLLENVFVGPVNVGNFRFVLQADPPDPSKIPQKDILGMTVILLSCSYLDQEFVRVGYYVENNYQEEQLKQQPPPNALIEKLQRNILTDRPRVTKFPINFHPENRGAGEGAPPAVEAHAFDEEDLPSSPSNPSDNEEPKT